MVSFSSSVSDFAMCLLLETTVCRLESQKCLCVILLHSQFRISCSRLLVCPRRVVLWAPGIWRPVLTTPGWAAWDVSAYAETHSGGVTGARCFSPQVGSVASGREMRMGIYKFPSLFLGLGWMGHSCIVLLTYRLVSSVDEMSLCQENVIIFPVYWTEPTHVTGRTEMKKRQIFLFTSPLWICVVLKPFSVIQSLGSHCWLLGFWMWIVQVAAVLCTWVLSSAAKLLRAICTLWPRYEYLQFMR